MLKPIILIQLYKNNKLIAQETAVYGTEQQELTDIIEKEILKHEADYCLPVTAFTTM